MDPRLAFWQGAGGETASTRAAAAVLWERVFPEPAVAALTDRSGLPVPAFARLLVRLAGHGVDENRDPVRVAVRYAGIMSRRIGRPCADALPETGNDLHYRVPLLPCEVNEGRTAFPALLGSGRCSILATVGGGLRPGAARKLAVRMRKSRQRHLFVQALTAGEILIVLADIEIRRFLQA